MKNNIEIIMLGDSLTARGEWKALFELDSVMNLGIDGETTKDIANRIDTVLSIHPKFVFIMAGINDMNYSISVDDIFDNYKFIIDALLAHGIKVIVQATLYTTMKAMNKKVTQLNIRLHAYCEAHHIEYVDMNPNFMDDAGLLREDLTTDGLHLSQLAYKVWAYKIRRLPMF